VPRVKRGTHRRASRKKVLARASGYFLTKSKLYRAAMEAVDRGRHEQAARVAVAGDGAGDVDEVHDGAAQDEAERIGVVGQHHLHHLGG